LRILLEGKAGALYLLVMVCAGTCQAFDALTPWAMKHLVDKATEYAGAHAVSNLWPQFTVLILVFSGAVIASRGYNFVDGMAAPAMRRRVQNLLVSHTLQASPFWLDSLPSGQLAQYIQALPGIIATFLDIVCVDIAKFFALIITSTLVIRGLSPMLALALVVWSLAYVGCSIAASIRVRRIARQSAEASARAAGEMMDVLSNLPTVAAFSGQDFEAARLQSHLSFEQSSVNYLRRCAATVKLIQSLLALGCIAVMTGLAAYWFTRGRISTGDVTMMFGTSTFLCMGLWNTSSRFSELAEQFGRAREILGRLQYSRRADVSEMTSRIAARPKQAAHQIEVIDMSFRYQHGPAIFQNASLSIRAGEKIGLIGASGAGKSTLVRLIQGYLFADTGSIRIDGVDVTEKTRDAFRSYITEVGQTPRLFNRSVLENVSYGRRSATVEEIKNACQRAHCHEFILRHPQAYQTPMGEAGCRFSPGERQRIVIARALLRDAPIVILDEPTSALDPESEFVVNEALKSLIKRRTVIFIAHRPESLSSMDRLIRVCAGRISDVHSLSLPDREELHLEDRSFADE